LAFSLEFHIEALNEWKALDRSVSLALRKKLAGRLSNPHVPAARLSGPLSDCYKIRHSKTGHRLVYKVIAKDNVVFVLAVAKREDKQAYSRAQKRL
jgi:mRNA interferase RelE/StbE